MSLIFAQGIKKSKFMGGGGIAGLRSFLQHKLSFDLVRLERRRLSLKDQIATLPP